MNRLRELREYNNLTLEYMQKILNKEFSVIAKYELNELEMSTDTLCKVADYFNTSIDYILYNTDEIIPHVLVPRVSKNRLKDLRKNSNLTQEDVSKLLFMSQNGYSDYERGRLDLPYNVLLILSSYYKTSIDYILCRTDDPAAYSKSKFSNV